MLSILPLPLPTGKTVTVEQKQEIGQITEAAERLVLRSGCRWAETPEQVVTSSDPEVKVERQTTEHEPTSNIGSGGPPGGPPTVAQNSPEWDSESNNSYADDPNHGDTEYDTESGPEGGDDYGFAENQILTDSIPQLDLFYYEDKGRDNVAEYDDLVMESMKSRMHCMEDTTHLSQKYRNLEVEDAVFGFIEFLLATKIEYGQWNNVFMLIANLYVQETLPERINARTEILQESERLNTFVHNRWRNVTPQHLKGRDYHWKPRNAWKRMHKEIEGDYLAVTTTCCVVPIDKTFEVIDNGGIGQDRQSPQDETKVKEVIHRTIVRLPSYLIMEEDEEEKGKRINKIWNDECQEDGRMLFLLRCVDEKVQKPWYGEDLLLKILFAQAYEELVEWGYSKPHDIIQRYRRRTEGEYFIIPIKKLLDLFIKGLEDQAVDDELEMAINRNTDNGYATKYTEQKYEKVSQEWVQQKEREREVLGNADNGFKKQVTQACFDRSYVRNWVENSQESKEARQTYKTEKKVDMTDKYQQRLHKLGRRKIRDKVRLNKWIQLFCQEEDGKMAEPEEVKRKLTIMGKTGGPCKKCGKYWHARNNHYQHFCHGCLKSDHRFQDCPLQK